MAPLIHHIALLSFFYAGSGGIQASALQQDYLRLLQEREQLSQNVKVMQQEVQLSKDKHLYLVVDLRSKQILLKMRGIVLKRISVLDVRKIGSSDCSTGTVILEESDSRKTPRILRPGSPDAVDIIDVSDMPQVYEFSPRPSDNGSVVLSVRPVPSTLLARAWLHLSEAFQFGTHSLMQTFGFGHPFYSLLLLPEHTQALYWTVEKDTPAILVCD